MTIIHGTCGMIHNVVTAMYFGSFCDPTLASNQDANEAAVFIVQKSTIRASFVRSNGCGSLLNATRFVVVSGSYLPEGISAAVNGVTAASLSLMCSVGM